MVLTRSDVTQLTIVFQVIPSLFVVNLSVSDFINLTEKEQEDI